MGEVIDLLKNQPHMEGRCICLECKHEEHCVAPLGVPSMECSKCGLMKSVWQGLAVPETVWECTCGCVHFFITEKNTLCCYCGEVQNFG